jgi:tetratricopeptide (TPR) repeat protein
VKVRGALAVVVLSAAVYADTPTPCPADRPVDEIISEIHRLQAKKNNRNPSLLPQIRCIWGWCRNDSATPPPVPGPAPRAEVPNTDNANATSESSSKSAAEKCERATDRALEAAHNVDVGDFYFNEKSYQAALLRYRDALEEKPDDAAIYVRVGRVYEKLKKIPEAIEHYGAAAKLAGPQKWTEEATAALARLQKRAGE